MFGFLKKKLKEAVKSFSKRVEEEAEPEKVVEEKPKELKKVEETREQKTKGEAIEKKNEKGEVEEENEKEVERKTIEKREEEIENKELTEQISVEKEEKSAKGEEVKSKEKKEDKGVLKEQKTEIVEEKTGEKRTQEEAKGEIAEKSEENVHQETSESDNQVHKSKSLFSGIKRIFSKKRTSVEEPSEVQEHAKTEAHEESKEAERSKNVEEERAKTFAQKIKEVVVKKTLTEQEFDKLFWDVEVVLLQNNVALEVIEKIKSDLKKELVDKKVFRREIHKIVEETLKNSVSQILDFKVPQLEELIKAKGSKPFVILFLGINGSGKTTTLAKVANYLKEKGYSCVLAAGDTFRAAAIQQLEEHAKNLNLKIIKQNYGSDSAAVAYDAIQYAKAHNTDVVLIDTAGRLHSNKNLMEELKKIVRVTKPDFKIFVGESITGNDCVEQAKAFNEQIGIDAIALTKFDVDDKGGAALSVAYVTKKPIIFVGTGQNYEDLKTFNKDEILNSLFSEQ